MASVMKRGLVLALIAFFVIGMSFQTIIVADARTPHTRARQLARNCDSPFQGSIAGCGGGDGKGGSPTRPQVPSGRIPGSSSCRNGCCGPKNKLGECKCC